MATKGKKAGTERRRVARAHIMRPQDSDKAFEHLEAEIAASSGYKGPTRLSVQRCQITQAEKVFQWRAGSERTQRLRDGHIQTLSAAARFPAAPRKRFV